jgi:hypothetical protein
MNVQYSLQKPVPAPQCGVCTGFILSSADDILVVKPDKAAQSH